MKNRRDFVRAAALGAAASQIATAAGELPRRKLGKTGLEVTVLGLGGGRVGTLDSGEQAADVIHRCLDLGINYFDTAAAGAYGLSQMRYGLALKDHRDKIIYGTKTRHRTFEHSQLDLNQSLSLLKTDHIDLYQIHNVMSDEDIETIFAPRGLMEMIEKAKKEGKIRFAGVTGHTDPGVMNRILERYEFDTVLIPLSVTDGAAKEKSFEKTTLPLARQQGLGVIAMKTLGVGAILRNNVATLQEAMAYVLSLPISTAIMGCDAVDHVDADIRAAANFKPLGNSAMEKLRRRASRFELASLEPWKNAGGNSA
jgi:predicted aldo/keto reductase-like oxidoreductase